MFWGTNILPPLSMACRVPQGTPVAYKGGGFWHAWWKLIETLIKGKRKAFSGAPGFEKFVQFNWDGDCSPVGSTIPWFPGILGRQHDMAIETHSITGKSFAF